MYTVLGHISSQSNIRINDTTNSCFYTAPLLLTVTVILVHSSSTTILSTVELLVQQCCACTALYI